MIAREREFMQRKGGKMKKRTIKHLNVRKLIVLCLVVLILISTSSIVSASGTANQVLEAASSALGKRASDFGFSGQWCAQFVGWCAKQAGVTDLVGTVCSNPPDFAKYILRNKTGEVYYFKETYSDTYDNIRLSLRDYHRVDVSDLIAAERSTFQPQRGDFICFLWETAGKDINWSHIGIVDKVENGRVYYYDGNSGNNSSVNYHNRSLTDKAITCYTRPYYTGSQPAAQSQPKPLSLSVSTNTVFLDTVSKNTATVTLYIDGDLPENATLSVDGYGSVFVTIGTFANRKVDLTFRASE